MVKIFSGLQGAKVSGVHHYLLAKGIDRKWAVFERLANGVEMYECDTVNGWKCMTVI